MYLRVQSLILIPSCVAAGELIQEENSEIIRLVLLTFQSLLWILTRRDIHLIASGVWTSHPRTPEKKTNQLFTFPFSLLAHNFLLLQQIIYFASFLSIVLAFLQKFFNDYQPSPRQCRSLQNRSRKEYPRDIALGFLIEWTITCLAIMLSAANTFLKLHVILKYVHIPYVPFSCYHRWLLSRKCSLRIPASILSKNIAWPMMISAIG